MTTPLSVLTKYYGHSQFRPGQQDLIDGLLSGRDVLGVMPTGAGKSVCYQIPAMLLPGTSLVVSPLISLMKDQVAALTQAGIPAAYINSSMTDQEYDETFRQAHRGAYKLLSGVARVEKKYRTGLGLTLIVRMLHGSKEQRVLELGLDQLSTYGIMKDTPRTQIRAYIDSLIQQGYLYLIGDEYPVLRLTDQASEVLFHGKSVIYTSREVIPEKKAPRSKAQMGGEVNESLYEALRSLRTELAQKEAVPAYIIFSNATLMDMAAKCPMSMEEFMDVSGVGQYKADRYGQTFIEAIQHWAKEQSDETAT